MEAKGRVDAVGWLDHVEDGQLLGTMARVLSAYMAMFDVMGAGAPQVSTLNKWNCPTSQGCPDNRRPQLLCHGAKHLGACRMGGI